MTTAMRVATVLALTATLIVAGCSGAGVSTYSLRGGPVETLAANHLAAFVLVKSWLVVLHSQPDPEATCDLVYNQEQLPDGTVHLTGTTSDCRAYDHIIRPDGSGEGVFDEGTEREVQMTWGPLVDKAPTKEQKIEKVFWDGMRMDYTWTGYFDEHPFVEAYEGTATLPDSRSMQFGITRVAGERERIDLSLADGSACSVEVPLRWPLGSGGFASDYAGGIEGHYVSPSGERLDFQGSGSTSRLAEWTCTSGGLSGEFAVRPGYACDGQVLQGGDLAASVQWSEEGEGTLDLISGERSEVGPTGAALDFAVDRWLNNAAMLGPTPLY